MGVLEKGSELNGLSGGEVVVLLGLSAEHFCGDEDDDGADESATGEEVDEGVADGGWGECEGGEEGEECEHGLWPWGEKEKADVILHPVGWSGSRRLTSHRAYRRTGVPCI